MPKLKEKLPVLIESPGATIRAQMGLGGMVAAYLELGAGTDLTPLLEGLPNDKCACPHWGYLIKGSFRIGYLDGREEMIYEGQVFYLPPGHTAFIEEDAAIIEFSPESEYKMVMDHVLAKSG